MRILLITQHYWPETVGTARRMQLLGEYLASVGHPVDVLCAWPNHPSMERYFRAGHDGWEVKDGVRIRRLPCYRAPLAWTQTWFDARAALQSATPPTRLPPLAVAHRLATYGSWVLSGSLEAAFTPGAYQVAVAVSPLPTGLVGVMQALRRRIPLVFDVQDIWPEGAVQAGILPESPLVSWLEALEQQVYARSQAVVVLSEGFRQNLLEKGVPTDRVAVIPNAVELGPHLEADGSGLRRRLGLGPEDTLVVYAGNLGAIQDLDTLLQAAQGLRHVEHLHFLLAGEGVERKRLEARATALRLSSLRFLPHQPLESVPDLLAAADICYLSLRAGGYTPGTVPSKLYEYLAAGRAVVNGVAGDAAQTVEAAGAGLNLPGGDVAALQVGLYALHADPGLRAKLGRQARAWVSREASQEGVGARYARLLGQICSAHTQEG